VNIKIDAANVKQILYDHYKEIIVILIYAVIFICVNSAVKSLSKEKSSLEFDENLAKRQYDTIKASNLSKNDLLEELKQLTQEISDAKEKLPQDLKIQDINNILTEIISDTGNLFNLGHCSISELKTKEAYKGYEVRITSINGNYYQFKNLLNYISNYRVKSQVTQLDITRTNSGVQGNLAIEFYGQKSEG